MANSNSGKSKENMKNQKKKSAGNTNTHTEKILKELSKEPTKYAKDGSGEKVPYKRIIKNNKEYTLVGDTTDIFGAYLYEGNIGDTVSGLKEGRNDFSLGAWTSSNEQDKVSYAVLIANNIKSERDFFSTRADLKSRKKKIKLR